jgi:hypothetical protein
MKKVTFYLSEKHYAMLEREKKELNRWDVAKNAQHSTSSLVRAWVINNLTWRHKGGN